MYVVNDVTRIREFLKQVLKNYSPNTVFEECLNYFCTSDKKFYKYYSLNSAFTLTNLINETIYLSKPLSFNDPFDCNLGITPDQVFQASQPEFIHKLVPDLGLKDCRDISAILFQDVPISKEKDLEIKRLLETDSSFLDLKKRHNKGEEISDYQILQAIKNNKSFRDILAIALSNGKNLKEIEPLLSQIDHIFTLIDSMPEQEASSIVSLAFNTMEGDGNFFEKIFKLAALSGQSIPNSTKENIYGMINGMQEHIRAHFNEITGVSCFSKSSSEILMWAHYADKHKGICVEYDFSRIEKFPSNMFLLPVIYTDNRPLLPVEKMYEAKDKLESPAKVIDLLPHFIEGFITKAVEWEYELEWRFLFLGNKDMSRKIHLPCISKIIAGANIVEDSFNALQVIADAKNVPLERLTLKKDKYELTLL